MRRPSHDQQPVLPHSPIDAECSSSPITMNQALAIIQELPPPLPPPSRNLSNVLARFAGLERQPVDESAQSTSMRTFITIPPTNFDKSRWKVGMCIVCFVFAGVAAGIIALLLTMNDGNNGGNPEQSTTDPATFLAQLQSQLLGSSVLVLRADAPQLQATSWLAVTDKPRLNLNAPNLQQRYALMVIWYAHGGKDWVIQGWANPGVHECDWPFLTCNENREVTQIIKGAGMQLTGSLVSEIGLLNSLEVLNFKSCQLEGEFPKEIFTLTNLQVMDFTDNEMSSTISASISNLTQLEVFHIRNNFFSGSLPSNFSKAMRSFRISTNDFTGVPWSVLHNWPELEYFDVSKLPMVGTIPTEIGLLTKLNAIELFLTSLGGQIPSEIGYLTALSKFVAYDSGLSGSIPTEFASCTKLMILDLSLNTFHQSSIPTILGNLLALNLLVLSGMSLTGTIPSEIGQLVNLQNLYLSSNFLTGTIPTEVANLDNTILAKVDFSYNSLTGDLPDTFCPGEVLVDCVIGACDACMSCICG